MSTHRSAGQTSPYSGHDPAARWPRSWPSPVTTRVIAVSAAAPRAGLAQRATAGVAWPGRRAGPRQGAGRAGPAGRHAGAGARRDGAELRPDIRVIVPRGTRPAAGGPARRLALPRRLPPRRSPPRPRPLARGRRRDHRAAGGSASPGQSALAGRRRGPRRLGGDHVRTAGLLACLADTSGHPGVGPHLVDRRPPTVRGHGLGPSITAVGEPADVRRGLRLVTLGVYAEQHASAAPDVRRARLHRRPRVTSGALKTAPRFRKRRRGPGPRRRSAVSAPVGRLSFVCRTHGGRARSAGPPGLGPASTPASLRCPA